MGHESQKCDPRDSTAHVTQQLLRDLDRATTTGRVFTSSVLLDALGRLDPRDGCVADRLARLAYQRGDWHQAIDLLDGARSLASDALLLRAACKLQLGLFADAAIDLDACLASDAPPPSACVLAAMLAAEHGDSANALALLRRPGLLGSKALTRDNEQIVLLCTTLLLIQQHRHAEAFRVLQQLHETYNPAIQTYDVMLITRSLGVSSFHDAPGYTDRDVSDLADALLSNEPLIAVLTEAQECHSDVHTCVLLRGALEQALPFVRDSVGCYTALARLCMMMNEQTTSQQWIDLGLIEHPMSVTLQRMATEHNESKQQDAPPTEAPRLAA